MALPQIEKQMPMPYEDIIAITRTVKAGQIDIPPYEGAADDLFALKNYIVPFAVTLYGVSPTVFETPTLLSTTLLRDMVHKVNWQMDTDYDIKNVVKEGRAIAKIGQDVGEMWRHPSRGRCGHMARSLYYIYRSLGYPVERLSVVDKLPDPRWTAAEYSHVFTQVFVADYQKFIIQDASFNNVMRDTEGHFLSFTQTRQLLSQNPERVDVTALDHAILFYEDNAHYTKLRPEDAYKFDKYFRMMLIREVSYKPDNEIVIDVRRILPPEDHTFSKVSGSLTQEWASCQEARKNADQCARVLRRKGYAVTGFRFKDAAIWLTLDTEQGYQSINYQTGDVLSGHYADIAVRAYQAGEDKPKGILSQRASLLDYQGGWTAYLF